MIHIHKVWHAHLSSYLAYCLIWWIFLSHISFVLNNNIQLMTGFEENSSFVWPGNRYVARSRRVKQNCCCPKNKSKTVLFCIFIFQNFPIHSFHSHIYPLNGFNIQGILTTLDIVTSISRRQYARYRTVDREFSYRQLSVPKFSLVDFCACALRASVSSTRSQNTKLVQNRACCLHCRFLRSIVIILTLK